jgi:hypothetical protein
MMRRSKPLALIALLATGLLAGCDDDGPGTVAVDVTSPFALGAVAVELRGDGFQDVELIGAGWLEANDFQDGSGAPGLRIVAVAETPGDFRFRLRVRDIGKPIPLIQVVAASDGSNQELVALEEINVTARRER